MTRLPLVAGTWKLHKSVAESLELAVAMPPEPGDYVFEFCLVQESYAWFDQLDPSLALRLPARVLTNNADGGAGR